MALETMMKIKEAEENAEKIEENARISAENMIKEAHINGKKYVSDTINHAAENAQKNIREAQKTADAKAFMLSGEWDIKISEMLKKASTNSDSALDEILKIILT